MQDSTRRFMKHWGAPVADDKTRCINMIEDLGNSFNKALRKDTLEAYATSLLERLTLKQIYESTRKLKFGSKFFPSIAEIIKGAPPDHTQDPNPTEFCAECKNIGLISRKIKGLDYSFRCTCPYGKKYMNIPLYNPQY